MNRQTQWRRMSIPAATIFVLSCVVVCCIMMWHGYLDLQKSNWSSALCDFAAAGNVSKIKQALNAGADPNLADAIGCAKYGKHEEVIPLLKQAGAKERN